MVIAKTLLCVMSCVQSAVSLQDGPDDSANVVELQRQVNLYRRAIDDFQSDNRDTQAKAILDLDLVKRSDLISALDRCKQLEQGRPLRPFSRNHQKLTRSQIPNLPDIEKCKQTIMEHEERYEEIRKAAEDMENRLGSGEYNAKVWRVVEFGGNPAAKDYAIRKETLEKLKQENEALIAKVTDLQSAGASSTGGGGEKTVPIEVFERLREEQEAEKALHEKRLLRLREVSWPWARKSIYKYGADQGSLHSRPSRLVRKSSWSLFSLCSDGVCVSARTVRTSAWRACTPLRAVRWG